MKICTVFESQTSWYHFPDSSTLGSQALEHRCSIDDHSGFCGTNKGAAEKGFGSLSSKTGTASAQKTLYGSAKLLPRLLSSLFGFGRTEHTLDPSRYRHAKRQLRDAFLEHYRCVESSKGRGWADLVPPCFLEGLGFERDANMSMCVQWPHSFEQL